MVNAAANESQRPFVLAVGLDLAQQESSGFAFDAALRIASRIPGSQMHVVQVLADEAGQAEIENKLGLLKLYVSHRAAALELRTPQRAAFHIRRGEAAKEISQLATDVGADMIVVGTHKPTQLRSLFVGSTAQRVMATATCPVFVAGPKPAPETPHVIVIEPPCPDCVKVRTSTGGSSWWCARHSESHHLRRHHIYSYSADLPFDAHDSEVTPIGTD